MQHLVSRGDADANGALDRDGIRTLASDPPPVMTAEHSPFLFPGHYVFGDVAVGGDRQQGLGRGTLVAPGPAPPLALPEPVLRVEQGKGNKDRYVMLSPRLLELLRDCSAWRSADSAGWWSGCDGRATAEWSARRCRLRADGRRTSAASCVAQGACESGCGVARDGRRVRRPPW